MKGTEGLQEKLFAEMRGRIQEADVSAPQRRGNFFYYTRMEEGAQFRIHCTCRSEEEEEEARKEGRKKKKK